MLAELSADGHSPARRSIALIESELIEAERAFTEADTRLSEAERDRRAALARINRRQEEFDLAVAELRLQSARGSRWRSERGTVEDTLILVPEQIADSEAGDCGEPVPPGKTVAAELDRLRLVAEGARGGKGLMLAGGSASA